MSVHVCACGTSKQGTRALFVDRGYTPSGDILISPFKNVCPRLTPKHVNVSLRIFLYHRTKVTSVLSSHAGVINARELLKILSVLPMGTAESERSFSFVRRILIWVRNRISTENMHVVSPLHENGHLRAIHGTAASSNDGIVVVS